MRVFIVSALCLFAALPAARAQSIQGFGVAGIIAGQASGNQGSTFKEYTNTTGSGTGAGSSASGTVFNMNGTFHSGVNYMSNGAASSTVTVSPFGVSTTSSHDATAFGKTWGDAGFNASNQTFGQSNGTSAFVSVDKTKSTSYENSAYKVGGIIGFLGFEGGYSAPPAY